MTPAQTREAGKVAIAGDDLATGFNGQCCEEGIGNQISPSADFPAKPGEYGPVPRPGPYHDAMRRIEQARSEGQCLIDRAGSSMILGCVATRRKPLRTTSETA